MFIFILAVVIVVVSAAPSKGLNRAYSSIEENRLSSQQLDSSTECYHIPQNPWTTDGGLAWMCENQDYCMACAPSHGALSEQDGFDHYRSEFTCDYSKCMTFVPYVLCKTDACTAI